MKLTLHISTGVCCTFAALILQAGAAAHAGFGGFSVNFSPPKVTPPRIEAPRVKPPKLPAPRITPPRISAPSLQLSTPRPPSGRPPVSLPRPVTTGGGLSRATPPRVAVPSHSMPRGPIVGARGLPSSPPVTGLPAVRLPAAAANIKVPALQGIGRPEWTVPRLNKPAALPQGLSAARMRNPAVTATGRITGRTLPGAVSGSWARGFQRPGGTAPARAQISVPRITNRDVEREGAAAGLVVGRIFQGFVGGGMGGQGGGQSPSRAERGEHYDDDWTSVGDDQDCSIYDAEPDRTPREDDQATPPEEVTGAP